MAKMYNFVIAGFGKTPEEALNSARSRLPNPDSYQKPHEYFRAYHEGKVVSTAGKFKVEIKYTPLEQSAAKEAGKLKRKSASFGPTDTFANTREIADVIDILKSEFSKTD